ncbi:type 3 dihydrofolate reductase [Marinobacteraceae bacterium S3BR75-40.1]
MRKTLMVAMAENRVIGCNNKLPWYLPEDLRYFKRTTTGKPIIMGRKTFESIGRPLPGRTNIVVTRDPEWSRDGVAVVGDIDAAFERAEDQATIDGTEELVVIGGGEIYHAVLPRMDRLYVTQVHAEVEGDAYFPLVNWKEWEEVAREDHDASENNPYPYSFLIFERRT